MMNTCPVSGWIRKHIKIYHDPLPHDLTDVFGMTYNQYTRPVNVTVDGAEAEYWMELLKPTTAITVANYTHRYWKIRI